MVVKCLFLFAVVIGFAYAQSDAPFLPGNLTIPPELEGQINEEALGEVGNKTKEVFKKKCEQNGGPDAFSRAENASADFMSCLQSLVDVKILQKEIEDAKPNGMVDEVFKKYCQKKPQFTGCFATMENSIKPCFSEDEKKNMKTVRNVTEQLVEFVCFKEGDRIALFIAEGGQECFEEKREELQSCANQTLGQDVSFKVDKLGTGDMPTLTFDEEQCNKMTVMQECMVGVLETCQKPTSANIVESLFKFIRNVTPCKEFNDVKEKSGGRDQKSKPNTANALPVTAATIAMGLFTAIFL